MARTSHCGARAAPRDGTARVLRVASGGNDSRPGNDVRHAVLDIDCVPCRAPQMGRLRKGSVGMPKPKKKRVEEPQPTVVDKGSPEAAPPPFPDPRPPPDPSKPPPAPRSPGKHHVQFLQKVYTEALKRWKTVEKIVKKNRRGHS